MLCLFCPFYLLLFHFVLNKYQATLSFKNLFFCQYHKLNFKTLKLFSILFHHFSFKILTNFLIIHVKSIQKLSPHFVQKMILAKTCLNPCHLQSVLSINVLSLGPHFCIHDLFKTELFSMFTFG